MIRASQPVDCLTATSFGEIIIYPVHHWHEMWHKLVISVGTANCLTSMMFSELGIYTVPHWDKMWYKVNIYVGNLSVSTQAIDQNWPSPCIHRIWYNSCLFFSVTRQSLKWVALCPKAMILKIANQSSQQNQTVNYLTLMMFSELGIYLVPPLR